MSTLRIGTRGSALALWQAHTVRTRLEAAGHAIAIVTIRTGGDRLQDLPDASRAASTDNKALFVKEIEEALLSDEIDIAVHSAKDMPAVLPDGLEIAAVLARGDPRDALVLPAGAEPGPGSTQLEPSRQSTEPVSAPLTASAANMENVLADLGEAPAIGTSSVRRTAQLAALLPRARFLAIRGNVDTRLRKLDDGRFDVLVLAAAGMIRLGLGARISATLPIDRCVPAPGQGTVAIEIRRADRRTRDAVAVINDAEAAASLAAERAVVAALGGGCQLPLGAIAVHVDGRIEMHALVASPDGRRIVRRDARGPAGDAARIGARLGRDLAEAGGMAILEEARRAR